MKTLKILIVLCIIFAFSTNNANSQKVIGTQTVFWLFSPNSGPWQIPCLSEVVSGPVEELQSFTNKAYHVKPRGVLHGETSGDDYEIKYEWNSFISPENSSDWHASLPMTLWHNGKLVAELHWVFHVQYNGQEVVVVEKLLFHVNCK